MLEALNRYAHGYVAVPVVVACRKQGLFAILRAQGPTSVPRLVEETKANEGHLRAALRLLQSVGWLVEEGGLYGLSPDAENEKEVPDDAVEVLRLPLEGFVRGEGPTALLAPWIGRLRRRWGARNPRVADLLDGTLAVRILTALGRAGFLAAGREEVLERVEPSARAEVGELFVALGWASGSGEDLTDDGRFILERALILGTLAAYTPMLLRMSTLLFGNAANVFDRDESGQERHVDRTLNVASSGFQHDRYFADVDDMLIATFDRTPLSEQPRYVADMGCGDGTFLKRVYETVRARTSRGKVLADHPLTLIGIDFNEAALEATRRTLAGLPHVLLRGDIGDPGALLGAFRESGVDPAAVLHIRSFLDHDRPFVPGSAERARSRERFGHRGVYVDGRGASIAPPVMMQALVEHLGRWAEVVNRHGLVVLEVHNLDPRVANAYFDSTESIHFDAYHAFSMQYLVEAAEFLGAAAESGLFPRADCSRRYPKTLPFARITLNWLEKRPYVIRPAAPEDLPALVALERASTSGPIQADEADLRARMDRYPAGQLVLEKGGRIAAAAYSQRIGEATALASVRHADLPALHRRDGAAVQLLGLVVHPDHQDLGLGDDLLEFVLRRADLLPGVEKVAGISRCKEWTRETPFSEYVHTRDEGGEPKDSILRFHARHGAEVQGIVPGYRPADTENDGHGVLIVYDLAERRAGTRAVSGRGLVAGEGRVGTVVEAAVKEVLGPRRREAFSPDLPLMDLGLDSMDLTELKSLLTRRLGLELDRTLFFRHRTAAAVSAHLATLTAEGTPASPATPARSRAARAATAVGSTARVPEKPPVPTLRRETSDARIAIVGMGCRFATANDVEEYWALLRDGVHAVREAPANRRGWSRHPLPESDPSIASAVRYGGFLDDVDTFDAGFFGIAPREARSMDPQQRILLETSWHALENAGIAPSSLMASGTGVFVGIATHDYELLHLLSSSPQAFDSHFTSGNLASVAAGRIAYCFGFHGPALSVDTACSSSLVALHLAAQSLRLGECDLALAAGVNLLLAREMSLVYARLRVLAPDGRAKTFDAAADGFVRGEGCGVVVLKRLEMALEDGDRILAVLRGSAVNQDGPSNGLTAPNGDAQEAVIRQALSSAGVSPLEVSHVETHGTGTVIGDPIEVQALGRVYGPGRTPDRPLVVSSAKTTVGHIEPAAGIAGLIKVVQSLQHGYIPPHLHLSTPNPLMHLEEIPGVIPTAGMPWRAEADGRPRLAGVSAFGLSGTNAHAIVEEAPPVPSRERSPEPDFGVLTLSARTPSALRSLAAAYRSQMLGRPELRTDDVCFTAARGRSALEHRLAVVFEGRDELVAELGRAAEGGHSDDGSLAERTVWGAAASPAPRTAFLFSGQGSQYAGMGRQLFGAEPVFRRALEECDEVLRSDSGIGVLSVLYPPSGETDLTGTEILQPALFAFEYALCRLWQSWGVEPDAVVGHSLGEYVAACVAGVLSFEDALRLVAARGRLMGSLPEKGIMVAVAADGPQAAAAISGRESEVAIASLNGPGSVVLSGRREAVMSVLSELMAEGTKALPVSNAFHSPLVEPILDAFEAEVRRVTLRTPDRVFVSNLLGRPVTDEVTSSSYWRRHLRGAVRFSDGMAALLQAGYESFVEIGPGTTLLGLGRLQPDTDSRDWLPSLRPGQPNGLTLRSSLARLHVRGARVDWSSYYKGSGCRKVVLPGYPFERKSYWFEDGDSAEAPRAAVSSARTEAGNNRPPVVSASIGDDFYEVEWVRQVRASAVSLAGGGRWLILADRRGVGEALARGLEASGERTTLVFPRPEFARTSVDRFTLDPARSGDFTRLLAETLPEGRFRGVVHLWSLDTAPTERLDSAALRDAQILGCASVLNLVQALAGVAGFEKPRVLIVTEQGQPVAEAPVQVAQAPLFGLGKTFQMENPELWGGMIDVEPGPVEATATLIQGELSGPDGESHVAYRGGSRLVARLTRRARPSRQRPRIRPDATYLVTGGTGGLGLRIARWLADAGARNIVLTSRRGPGDTARREIQTLESRGVRVSAPSVDVTSERDMRTLFQEVGSSFPPLAGVVHAAGITVGALLVDQKWDRFAEVLDVKAAGSWNLHAMTRDMLLDFFVCFSSASSLLGSPGQSSYAAGNAFQDALAHHRVRSGLPGLSVNWGFWGEVGMAMDMPELYRKTMLQDRGLAAMDPGEALEALGDLMAEGRPETAVFPVSWAKFVGTVTADGDVPPYLARVAPRTERGPAAPPAGPGLLGQLNRATSVERRLLLSGYLRERVARIMGYPPEQIHSQVTLLTLGFDSLMAVQLRNHIRANLAVDIPVSVLFDSTTLAALADLLEERLAFAAGHGEHVEVI